jgi:hypothetical protein
LGLRHIYNLLLPDVRGRERREFFNWVSDFSVVGMGLFGALAGFSIVGPVGAIVGFFAASAFMAYIASKYRFYRP